MSGYIYLASPYSHPEAAVREVRYQAACKRAAEYADRRQAVFAPIAYSHPIADHMDEAKRMDFGLWMDIDLPLLRHAEELHVLKLDGWESSRGVAREIEYARALRIPVRFLEP